MKTYPNFFARDGYINMWARSICYRTWVSGGFPFPSCSRTNTPWIPAGPGACVPVLCLQFVGREDFFENDIPSLGFYGHREFVVQNYSCPASPFIMFLPFIALALPEDSPFWTATENEGYGMNWVVNPGYRFLAIQGLFWSITGKPEPRRSSRKDLLRRSRTIQNWCTTPTSPGRTAIPMAEAPWNTASAAWIPGMSGERMSISTSPESRRPTMDPAVRTVHPCADHGVQWGHGTTSYTGRPSCASRRTTALATSSIWPR
jgi:hypothetical protein